MSLVRGPLTLSVDIGGTGMKMLTLDGDGKPITERVRKRTPQPATPKHVLTVLREMVAAHEPFDRISIGFPGVVKHGVVHTAPNLEDRAWRGQALKADLEAMTGRPVRVINDADLQGYGVISGRGVEMVLTLGTGLGAALFSEGHLLPNLELGHHPFRGTKTYEQRVSDRALDKLGQKKWSARVIAMLEQLEPIFNYDVLYMGGGNARKIREPLPANVVRFDSVEGLRGGSRLWADDAH